MFAYHNSSARLIASLTECVKRAQTAFSHLEKLADLHTTGFPVSFRQSGGKWNFLVYDGFAFSLSDGYLSL